MDGSIAAGSAPSGIVARRTVWCLGVSQLVCWGITFYMIALFGEPIAADMGWSRSVVFGGFSAALVVMGATSPLIGRLIDERGGRPVMVAGSCLSALGCLVLSFAQDLVVYYAAWVVLGVAMRMCLYEAAFAALARIAGPAAKRPISQITLLGGLTESIANREPNVEVREIRNRRMLLAIQRGFCASLLWSPLAFAIAISTSIVPGSSWSGVAGLAIFHAVMVTFIGWALDTIYKPKLTAAATA